MAMFLCGGSNLLENKAVTVNAKSTQDVVATYTASSENYDGYEKVTVTVPHFATLGVKEIHVNGEFPVTNAANSYTAVNVDVHTSIDDTYGAGNYQIIWQGNANRSNPNVSVSYNADTLYAQNYRYLEFFGKNSTWTNPDTGEERSGNEQLSKVLVPLKEYGLHSIGFFTHVNNFSSCSANMPFNIIGSTSIVLCPSGGSYMGLTHLYPTGSIYEIRAIR